MTNRFTLRSHRFIRRFLRLGSAAAFGFIAGCASEAKTPAGLCIAPANPGGGWDFSCRATSQVLGAKAPGGVPLRVSNVPGDGGGVAFKSVVSRGHDSEPVIVAASPSTLLGLAQHHYGDFTERDVRWIAAVDAEPSIIAVGASAPWKDLKQFVAAWRAQPDSIVIGGTSAIGGQDHMKMLLLARTAGLDVRRVRYESVSSPAEAISMIKSGKIQVFPAELSKMLPEVERKELRVLAVLGDKRATGLLANVPTAREQGFDVVFMIWRGFYAPAGITEAEYQNWVANLKAMISTPEWKAVLSKNELSPFFVGGKDFETFVREQTAAYRTLSKDIGIVQ